MTGAGDVHWLLLGVENTGHVTMEHCFTNLYFIVFLICLSFCFYILYRLCLLHQARACLFWVYNLTDQINYKMVHAKHMTNNFDTANALV